MRGPEDDHLCDRFRIIRQATEALAAGLTPEDMGVQSMADASPTKWHLAHTAWFFETFVLAPLLPGYPAFEPAFAYLFNSYYEAAGPRQPRPERGLLSRPAVVQILAYRRYVDAAMETLLADLDPDAPAWALAELGLQHEQQHQELILTDIKHAFWRNPLNPAYDAAMAPPKPVATGQWVAFPGGLVEIGARGPGFAFDNERPRHRVYVEPFRMASRLVSNGAFLDFMADGGYHRPELWLSDGWALCRAEGWEAPLYWQGQEGAYSVFTLAGPQPLDPDAALCHVSHYEAAAYAAWAGFRLPTEAEWELAASVLDDAFGTVWQWTASAYLPYPGFRAAAGALGEYNGKFMSGQMVLRGGSVATPAGHARASYRNFFPPAARWQFSGLRLAADQ